MDNYLITKKILEIFNIKNLNPVQNEAIHKDLLDKKNLIISSPTASGKTLCAITASLKCHVTERKKVLYLCPLVALAQEHYDNFKNKFSQLGIKIALSIGDLDNSDQRLRDYDWIICSNEKMDSLLRHGIEWINDVGLVVVDEIHLISDYSRGPTLEILLTKLKLMIPKAQIVGLSATINNIKELSEWLDSDFIVSSWRPVKLYEGVSYDGKINFLEKRDYYLSSNISDEKSIVEDTLNMKKQILIFVSTRRNAESLAEKLSIFVNEKNLNTEKTELNNISLSVLNALEIPTIQCEKLSKCVDNGIAFHHAGLVSEQRKIIENGFREGKIKVIVATPTLSMGINLPAFRVIVRDLRRYYTGLGSMLIPVIEYKQFVGRAGRPQYDEFGESIIFARNELQAQELIDKYILSDTEDIESKLSDESALRSHVLSLIASNFVKNMDELKDFFKKTFYYHQKNNLFGIDKKIDRIIKLLIKFDQIKNSKNNLEATKIGKRISELYLDPLSGHIITSNLRENADIIGFLQLAIITPEFDPLPSIRSGETEILEKFLIKIPDEWDSSYDNFLKSVKLTTIFYDWLNEISENQILIKYNITPGELRNKLLIADWLFYSIYELCLLLKMKIILSHIKKIRIRLRYGIKEELIPLVKLQSIGRVRARRLYNSNIKDIGDLRKIDISKLTKILGEKIAFSIKKQLGEKTQNNKI